MENNIWIKPDFYSTRTVNSPGFFTLVHPKITHKTEFIKDIVDTLSKIVMNQEEPVVSDWIQRQQYSTDESYKSMVPKFHRETSTRKWGV